VGFLERLAAFFKQLLHRVLVAGGAVLLTVLFFLVLPLMQAITRPPETDLIVRSVDTAELPPPPPPPPEEQQEDEPEPEAEPPELTDEAPPLSLDQLELALNAGFGDGMLVGDFAVKLETIAGTAQAAEALFSIADLDQRPRVIYQPSPTVSAKLKKQAPGTVNILFIVDERGKVESPIVQSSTDPVFEGPALSAVKQWKFEPGMRNGQAVRFRMRVPITFPKG
jgi:protein TonB